MSTYYAIQHDDKSFYDNNTFDVLHAKLFSVRSDAEHIIAAGAPGHVVAVNWKGKKQQRPTNRFMRPRVEGVGGDSKVYVKIRDAVDVMERFKALLVAWMTPAVGPIKYVVTATDFADLRAHMDIEYNFEVGRRDDSGQSAFNHAFALGSINAIDLYRQNIAAYLQNGNHTIVTDLPATAQELLQSLVDAPANCAEYRALPQTTPTKAAANR